MSNEEISGPDAPRIEFPCDYPIKVIAIARDDLLAEVSSKIATHVPGFEAGMIRSIPSRAGRFVSLRFTMEAQSEAHIKALFADLKAIQGVQMVL